MSQKQVKQYKRALRREQGRIEYGAYKKMFRAISQESFWGRLKIAWKILFNLGTGEK